MKNRFLIIVCLAFAALALVFMYVLVHKLQPVSPGMINGYEKTFVDLQRVQIRAATQNGIGPFESKEEAVAAYKNDKLKKIKSNRNYHVRNLTHSVPYVIPEMAELLEDIAESFREISGTKARFEVTSVLRTKEDVGKLQKANSNATSNSCHLYGTTVDISYARFKRDFLSYKSNDELRHALSEAIGKLRKEKRCYVKFEEKQKCYHITVR